MTTPTEARLTDQELQSLRNLGFVAEAAADEIVRLRAALLERPMRKTTRDEKIVKPGCAKQRAPQTTCQSFQADPNRCQDLPMAQWLSVACADCGSCR